MSNLRQLFYFPLVGNDKLRHQSNKLPRRTPQSLS